MKNSHRSAIALAVCAVLGTSAANALTRAQYQALPATSKAYVGGATATDNTLEEVFISLAGGICASNIDIYRVGAQRVITCTVTDASGGAGHGFGAGTNVAFHKESNGGSSNGVTPLLNPTSHGLVWLDVGALTSDCTVTTVAATTNLAGYINHASCSLALTPANTFPTGGISDTEPSLSFPAPSAVEVANELDFQSALDIVFGVPVTKGLYKALQIAQFGDTSPCDTNTASGAFTISDTDPACVPSLTRSQIAALYTQTFGSWDNIVDKNGTSLTAVPGVTAPTGIADPTLVRICRRVATSGTQAATEAYWLNQRCVDGVRPFAGPDDASTITDTSPAASDFDNYTLVNAGPGSGDVRNCLRQADSLGYWGIGVLSTEVTAGNLSGASDKFRFIGIDGFAPTLANVANGDYDFYATNTVNRIKTTVPGAAQNGQIRYELVEILPTKFANTTILANLDATFSGRPWGNGGVLALAGTATSNTAPYSTAELAASPVNAQTRLNNNCQPSLQLKASPTP